MTILKSIHSILVSIYDLLKESKKQNINITLTCTPLDISKDYIEKSFNSKPRESAIHIENLKKARKEYLEKEFDDRFSDMLKIGITDKERYSFTKDFYVNQFY